MLVASRLAGLSALETPYAGVRARAQFGRRKSPIAFKAPRHAPQHKASPGIGGARFFQHPQAPPRSVPPAAVRPCRRTRGVNA